MTPLRQALVLASLGILPALHAQSFTVDAANRPGTDYTSIVAAVQAVPSGSVLRIRDGVYSPFTIAGKSLRLLAEANVRVLQPLQGSGIAITGIAAHQTVVLSGMMVGSANITPVPVTLACSNARGPILLDNLIPGQGGILSLRTTDCDQVLVRGGAGWRTMEFSRSHAVVEGCSVFGIGWVTVGMPSVAVAQGSLQWIDSTVEGSVTLTGTSVSTIQLTQGELRLLGTSRVRNALAPFCISGSGSVRFDPAVEVTRPGATGVAAIDPALLPVLTPMPKLTVSVTATAANVRLVGRAGDLALVALSLPGPRFSLPGLGDAFWIDAAVPGPLAIGVIGSTPWSSAFALPPGRLPGVRATWQAVTWDQAADWQVSNPTFAVLDRP